jgi:Zn-dependent M28 family amino/carboxypeptidase
LKRSTLAVALLLACTAVHADYDAKMEAQEAAQRKAAAAAEAKRKAEVQKQIDARNQEGMRAALGKEAEGKSDAEVKKIYDAKIAGYKDEAKKVQAGGTPTGVPASDMAKGNAQMKSMTGKSMQDIQKMTPAEQEAFANQMEKQYGGAAK